MRIVIVDAVRDDRELATRLLSAAGHDVQPASDIKGATALIERQTPDVLVLDWATLQAAEFLKRVRAMELSNHIYIVVTSLGRSPADLVNAIAAGADDYMKKPLGKDELVTRVTGIERIRRWASRVLEKVTHDWSEASSIPELRAWRDADRSFTRDLEVVVGTALSVSTCPNPFEQIAMGAEIPLSLAAEGLEVRLAIGLDQASLLRVASMVLGMDDAPPEVMIDVVREFANTAGGAFKRAAVEEGVTLTTGLPCEVLVESWGKAKAQQKFTIQSEDGSIKIGVHIEVRSRALVRTTVGQLCEGMVLARDLLNEAGTLLVAAGTRLTQTQIERVARVLSTKSAVEVAQAA